MRRTSRAVLTLPLSVVLLSCGDSGSDPPCGPGPVSFTIPEPVSLQTVGVTQTLTVDAEDGCGLPVGAADLVWQSFNPAVATVDGQGTVTAEGVGSTTIQAVQGTEVAGLQVVVHASETGGRYEELGFTEYPGTRLTDLWMVGDRVLTGTGAVSNVSCPGPACMHPVVVWNATDPDALAIADSLRIPAGLVNDVKIRSDGAVGIATMEGGIGGIVTLDLTTPGTVTAHATFTDGLEVGVHNAWIDEAGGRTYAYLATDGSTSANGLHVLDITDPTAPERVSTFWAGSSSLHDVYVRDGLAFLSHWDAGLVILDVGDGRAGGAPDAPVEVSRLVIPGGNTHNAWYWPERELVFVGQEVFAVPGQDPAGAGSVFVVDVADMANPAVLATWQLGEFPPHNFWLDEEAEVLHVAWYGNGLRALDVSGPLSGSLEGQSVELAAVTDVGPQGRAWFWAPQLHNGRIYGVTNQGIWVYSFSRN